jgi:hypothetical protein
VSLENLLKIEQRKPHAPDAAEIERLLAAARRNLRGSRPACRPFAVLDLRKWPPRGLLALEPISM